MSQQSQFLYQYDNFRGFEKFIDTRDGIKRKHKINKSPRKKKSSSYKEKLLTLQKRTSAEENFQQFQLRRTSSYDSLNTCEHCQHDHRSTCCMYVYDDHSDIEKYASFIKEIERPYTILTSCHDFNFMIGASTPDNFPFFSENDSLVIDKKIEKQKKSENVVYIRQYFWPLFLPSVYIPNFDYNNNFPSLDNQYPQGIMRQVAISLGGINMDYNGTHSTPQQPPHPQVIENHTWIPWWMLK